MDDGTNCSAAEDTGWIAFMTEVCDELCKLDPSRDDRGDFS